MNGKNNSGFLQGLQVYLVGGAVRDSILRSLYQPSDASQREQAHTIQYDTHAGDRDWVVIGATPQQMLDRGFIAVGGDFPVFIHPQTKEEYALGRTERKSGKGYQAFVPYFGVDVTLEQDLQRRDLTINAIAQSVDGQIIDPFNGLQDLQHKILRHVSVAFLEDPVRILRLGRFLARFIDFDVAPETLELCREMVANGEVDALVPERIWKEISRGLLATKPSHMFAMLQSIGALQKIMPFLKWNQKVAQILDATATTNLSLAQRYAILCIDTDDIVGLSKRLKVQAVCMDYALQLRGIQLALTSFLPTMPPVAQVLNLIERTDAVRKPERFLELIQAYRITLQSQSTQSDAQLNEWHNNWQKALAAVLSVNAGEIAKQCEFNIDKIKIAVQQARLKAIKNFLS